MEPYPAPFDFQVDLLPRSALALPGRLGLARAPGRWSPGRHLDSDVRLRDDLKVIASEQGARMLVTLLERSEIVQLGNLRREARRAGLEWVHFPIPDMWVPSDVTATRRLVDRMLGALEGGESIVVHCWGGLGRTGTIAACCLVAHGREPRHAIAIVRSARAGALQSMAQELFVSEFAASLGR
jgi:hypothetical protein